VRTFTRRDAKRARAILRGVGFRAAAILALGGAFACSEGEAAHEEPSAVVVEVLRVQPELFIDTAVFSGQLDAEYSVMIKPEIQGVIESIEIDQGQKVAKGDVLFRMRDGEQAAKLREAEANRDLAHVRWKRASQLVSANASSAAAADAARAEWEVARARVDLARVDLERTRIRAPFDGVVGQRHVDPGSRVEEEDELIRVDAVDRLQLTFAISDEGLPFAKPGMRVNAWVRPYPGEKFPGEVFFVSPALDPTNRRIWVKAWIDNADRRLAPGLFANVDLELRRDATAIVLPESAVAIDHQGPYVWKVGDDDTVTRQPVEVGVRERGIVEIVQGLPVGTRVVSAGTHKVSEGSIVRAAENPLVGRARKTPAEGSLIGEGT
jgi:membrane fusion protein (multidrug efflux system)